MEITGERHIPASREQVWRALTNLATLQSCLPHNVTIRPAGTSESPDQAALAVASPDGGFHGHLALRDRDPPASCRFEAFGNEGPDGVDRAWAAITLEEEGITTRLRYTLTAELHGTRAGHVPGSIETPARAAADAFFDNLTASVAGPPPIAADGPAAAAAALTAPSRLPISLPKQILGFPPFAWIGAGVFVFILYNLFLS